MTDNPRKTFGGKGTMDGYRCELCGAWVEYRDLGKVLAHEGPLPHVDQDRPDRDRILCRAVAASRALAFCAL